MIFPAIAFDSMRDVFVMGGHGLYVWSAWLIVIVALSLLAWVPYRMARRVRRTARNV